MTGKQSKLVLEWLSEFINDPTVSYDQRDIDFFINNLSRNDWIERAWDIFMFIIQTIQSESYDVTVCLSFTLEPYNRPKKASNYFIKTKALSKSSPPGISLMRGRYQHFIKESTCSSLNSYDKKYNKKYKCIHCYFLQLMDCDVYNRWIDIVYERDKDSQN
jgi:hypothetical protein